MPRTKKNASTGFDVLERLWNKDFVPKDLERHYFLYWFALHSGDVDHISKTLRLHRNSIQFQFDRLGLTEKTIDLRKFWLILAQDPQKNSFESDFLKFLHMDEPQVMFASPENKALIELWKSGFPFRALSAHYMLWALRNGQSKLWVQKRIGFSSHHCMRLLVSALDPRTENGRWLAPLAPRPDEIYSRGPRNGYIKLKELERHRVVSE
jgi:hypothetical protein